MMIDEELLKNLINELRELKEELKKQKQYNETLIESQNIQKVILERSVVGYYISLNGKFHFMNSIAISYTGYEEKELIGQKSDFMIHPEDKEEVRRNAREMLKGVRTSPYEFRIVTKQGAICWVLEAVVPIMFEGCQAILANTMDVTQRKIGEQKLIESENLYRAIFENTGTMTMIADENKTINLLNHEWEKQTGYCREDWEGKKKWMEYIDKRDIPRMEEYHRLRRIDPNSVPGTYECHFIDSQGRTRIALATVGVIPGTKKNVASSIDITELKEAEQQLISKSENLTELNAALKVLLKQREADKSELETNLLTNVREFILPYIEKIRNSDKENKYMPYVDLLSSNLENILAPFSRTLSAKYMSLTDKEIEVANFIRQGKNSKEIATLLNVSSSCVDIHRYHIRRKLGLNNKQANLRAFLQSFS